MVCPFILNCICRVVWTGSYFHTPAVALGNSKPYFSHQPGTYPENLNQIQNNLPMLIQCFTQDGLRWRPTINYDWRSKTKHMACMLYGMYSAWLFFLFCSCCLPACSFGGRKKEKMNEKSSMCCFWNVGKFYVHPVQTEWLRGWKFKRYIITDCPNCVFFSVWNRTRPRVLMQNNNNH